MLDVISSAVLAINRKIFERIDGYQNRSSVGVDDVLEEAFLQHVQYRWLVQMR